MKAAPQQQKQLLAVQEIDNDIARENTAVRRLNEDAVRASLDDDIVSARREHLDRVGAWEDRRAELARIESDVAAVEARTARDLARLESTSSLKDIQGLETELKALHERQDRLEDTQLAAMEEVEELESAVEQAQGRLTALEERQAADRAQRDRDVETHRARLRSLATERDAALAGLPGELVDLYEKQRARYGIGAALLRGGVSLGSHTTLNPADMQEIRQAAPDDVILCPESSCILVRTEESGL